MDDLNNQNSNDTPARPLTELPQTPDLSKTDAELKRAAEQAQQAAQRVEASPLPNAYPQSQGSYALPQAPTTNAWAIVSLVSSILGISLVPILGSIVGIIAGLYSRSEIASSRGTQSGDGLALAGIIISGATLAIGCIGIICAFAFFGGLGILGAASSGF